MALWISESPPEEPFFLLWRQMNEPSEATNSNIGDLLKQVYVQSLPSPTHTTSDFTAIDGKVVFKYETWQKKSSQNIWIYTITLMKK